MAVFDEFIRWLNYYSVADVLLPFILVFTIVFAVLQKSEIFGEESKKFNTVIALVMGLAVVFPHVLGMYGPRSVVDIINSALPQVSLVVIAIVMFMLLLGIFGKDVQLAGASASGLAVLLSLVAVVVIFGNAAGWFRMPRFLSFLEDPGVQSLIVVILVFGLIIKFVTSDPDKERQMGKSLNDLFGDIIK